MDTYQVESSEAGCTVLQVLGERLWDVPSATIRGAIEREDVLLDGRPCGPNQHVQGGEEIEVAEALTPIESAPLEGFAVVWSDAELLACYKPPGVSVEAERGDAARPFKAAVIHHLVESGQAGRRPRIAHRIDRDTSGLVLVALSRAGLRSVTAQFEAHAVHKVYEAIAVGAPTDDAGTVDLPVGPRAKKSRKPDPTAKREARTRWEVVERLNRRFTWIRAFPETGRQHQIRQHLQSLGCPIACDGLYGSPKPVLLSELKRDYRPKKGREERPVLARLGLHATSLRFRGSEGEEVEVRAPLPKDMEVALKQLRRLR